MSHLDNYHLWRIASGLSGLTHEISETVRNTKICIGVIHDSVRCLGSFLEYASKRSSVLKLKVFVRYIFVTARLIVMFQNLRPFIR
jgi:hypothetical protein